MAKSRKPAAAAPTAAPTGPKPTLTRKLPDSLGGGEARLYDLRVSALPDVVNTPKEKDVAEWPYWLVHFPSRRCVAVKSVERTETLRLMKQLERGVDELGLVPALKEKKVKRVRERARAREADEGEHEVGEIGESDSQIGFTAVPEGLDFDRAMAHVFPVARITQHFERLLMASEDVIVQGKKVGSRPAFTTQFQTLKALTEWHVGRPREKEKQVEKKAALTVGDMRKKLMASPEYRAAILELVTDCEKEAQRAAAVAQSGGMQPPTTEGKA